MTIKIYIRTTEPWSQSLVHYLKDKGINYDKVDVSIDENAFEEMVQKSGQKKVPVIDIGGKIVTGFDRSRIEEILANC